MSRNRIWGAKIGVLLILALIAGMGAMAGCGSSGDGGPPTSQTSSTHKPFAPAKAVDFAVTTDPNLPRWFFLVNGNSVPSPIAQFTPSVLSVNGAGPPGAPNPNGGTLAALAPMTFVTKPVPQASPSAVATTVPFPFTGAQVWQAVPGTEPGYVNLRSGESFAVDTTNNPVGSLMLGYGATEANLELGVLGAGTVSAYHPAIFLDQSDSPTGDNSAFEQWSYDTSTAQLTDRYIGGQLYSSGGSSLGVGGGSTAPGNQWYAVPNYHLLAVTTRENDSPLFPPWINNQQAAYNWISEQPGVDATGPCNPVLVGVGINQTATGQCFTGVRNEYQNSNFNATATNATIQGLQYPAADSPPFAPADLTAVQSQLNLELTYVADVQSMFANVRTVIATVFWQNTNTLAKVITDLDVSQDAHPLAVAAQIAEGTLYTLLSAAGNIEGGAVAGVVANILQTVFDTTAVTQPTFEQEVGGTVGELAGNLNTQFNYMSDALTLDYNTIVYDWSRLSEVGPETQQTGYWGLFWPDTLTGIVVPYMVNGYEISVMKALLPLTYNLHEVVGQTSADVKFPGISSSAFPPSYAQYAWDFGSGSTTTSVGGNGTTNWAGYYNQGFWETGGFGAAFFKYPDSTVMQDDLLNLGANPFEVFSGIDGWGGGAGTVYYPNLSCEGVVVSLFNDTSSDLWVNYTTKQGEESGPGDNYGGVFDSDFGYGLGGRKGTAWAELRPFGYSTMYFAQDNVTPTNQTGSITIFDTNFSTSNPIASFEEGQDGCTADSHTNIHSGSFTADNYSWSDGLKTRGQSSGEPGGVWGVLVNSMLNP